MCTRAGLRLSPLQPLESPTPVRHMRSCSHSQHTRARLAATLDPLPPAPAPRSRAPCPNALRCASLQVVGRLAAQLARLLQGKDKPTFSPSADCGDVCVVVNAEKIVFTGRKWDGKIYQWHTGESAAGARAPRDRLGGDGGAALIRRADCPAARRAAGAWAMCGSRPPGRCANRQPNPAYARQAGRAA